MVFWIVEPSESLEGTVEPGELEAVSEREGIEGVRWLSLRRSPWAAGLLLALGWLFAQPRPAESLDPRLPVTRYVRRAWGVADGLPQRTITAIAQGPRGYLWLGTQEGLVRFDGERFVVYRSGTTPGLESSFVSALALGRDGRLWVGTMVGGLSWFEKGVFTAVGAAEGLPSNHISCLLAGSDGGVWVGTIEGQVAEVRDGSVRRVIPANGRAVGEIHALVFGRDGELVVGARGGLFRLVGSHLERVAVGRERQQPEVLGLWADRENGELWVATNARGLYVLKGGRQLKRYTRHDGLFSNTVWRILGDRDGNRWLAAPGGLKRLSGGAFQGFREPNGRPNTGTLALFEDSEGDLWVGTDDGLLELCDPALTTYADREGFPTNLEFTVNVSDSGTIWLVTQAGLYRLDHGRLERLPLLPGIVRRLPILSTLIGHDESIWIGTAGSGLFHFRDGRLEHRFSGAQLGSAFVTALLEDERDVVWVGTAKGLATIVRGQVRRYPGFGAESGAVTSSLAERGDGAVWVATHQRGLYLARNGRIERARGSESLAGVGITVLHPDEEDVGTLWIGTLERGLFRLQSDRLDNCTSRQGLPDDTLLSLLEDGHGNLWLGTNHGIVKVAKCDLDGLFAGRSSRIGPRVYGVADGMRSPECRGGTPPAAARSADDRLYFSTTAGLVEIDPARLRPNRVPPKVVIEAVTADGQRLMGDPVRVPAGARRLVFQYQGLSLRSPKRVRFRYQLRGFDDQWVEGGARREATYTGLRPGEYRFFVSAVNADGVWSDASATLDLVVVPAFWQTPYFYAASLLLLVAACVGAHRLRLARLRAENAILRERERISAEVHDVVAQTFSGALLKLERAEVAAGSGSSEVRELVSDARHLLAESWREIRRTIQGLRPRALERNELCAALGLLVDSLSGAGPAVHFEIVGKPQPLSEDTANGLWRFTQEALANAARHAEARNIWVRLEYDAELVRLGVTDDGRGLAGKRAREPGAGMGLSGMERQARARGWDFVIRSAATGGTEIRVEAPLRAAKGTGSGS